MGPTCASRVEGLQRLENRVWKYPPMSRRYLHTLFSSLCSPSTFDAQVGTTALLNRIAGMHINFQIAFPTTTLSALFRTSAISEFTFLSALELERSSLRPMNACVRTCTRVSFFSK